MLLVVVDIKVVRLIVVADGAARRIGSLRRIGGNDLDTHTGETRCSISGETCRAGCGHNQRRTSKQRILQKITLV